MVRASFVGTSPVSHWQSICGFTNEGPPRAEGARITPPTEWIPTQATVPNLEELQDLPDLVERDAVVDDDDQTTNTIGSLKEEQFAEDEQTLRCSNRNKHQVERFMIDAMMSEILDTTTDAEGAEFEEPLAPAPGKIFCMQSVYGIEGGPHPDDEPLLAYAATNDPETFYYHQVVHQPDFEQFQRAMEMEIENQWDNGNFKLIKHSSLKKGTPVLPGVSALTKKRHILTGEIYKHKACWNLDGSKQVQGWDFNETHSPTAQWPIIHLFLVNVLINKWKTRQLNLVQAFSQALISHKQLVDIPKRHQDPGNQSRQLALQSDQECLWRQGCWEAMVLVLVQDL
jgi:hypothetical protein